MILISPVPADTASEKNGWKLTLSGDIQKVMTQEEFETKTDYHQPEHHFASIIDTQGSVWDGMPLRELARDISQDTGTSSNLMENGNARTENGNLVLTVTGSDGKKITLDDQDIFSGNQYILANSVNGNPLSNTDKAYPLVLVGKDLQKTDFISGVSAISLSYK